MWGRLTSYVGRRQGAELQKRLKAGLQGLMLWGQLLPFHLLSWLLLKLLRKEQGGRIEGEAVLIASLRTSSQ